MQIPIAKIIVGPRQRTDLGDPLNDLQSMSDPDVGQINPITVERQLDGTYHLLAGNRRLTKAKALGWVSIEATERTGINEIQRQKIEFIEDVERKDRTWQEKCTATYRLHHMLRMEREEVGGKAWTVRAMSTFTGFEKSSIGYMLQIGEALLKEPPDEEIRGADGYTKAIAVLIERTARAVQQEMERRQALVAKADATQLYIGNPEVGKTAAIEAAAGAVQLLDTTPGRTPRVKLHGRNKAFRDAMPDEDFGVGLTSVALGYRAEPEDTPNLVRALRPTGYAVLWQSVLMDDLVISGQCFPHLIWNQIDFLLGAHAPWPFILSHVNGEVYSPSLPNHIQPISSVISAVREPDDLALPLAVVDFSISHIVSANMAVLCIAGVNPVHVAQLGFVPIWFEPDALRYEALVAELTTYYKDTIPGVEVEP